MTDTQLRDEAVALLEKTTVGYVNSHWKTPPAGTFWAQALAVLSQVSSTNAAHVQAALTDLRLTTVGYINKNWKTPPAGTHWANGLVALAAIVDSTPVFAQLPVGPFAKHSSEVYHGTKVGSVISKLDIENVPGNNDGLAVMEWPAALSTSRYTISDIIVQNVGNVPPTSNGTAEAGIWLGQSADVDRVVCDGSWEGFWTGAECADSIIRNLTVGKRDAAGGYSLGAGNSAGLYLEHFTRRCLFQNFDIHSLGHVGIISEWWYPDDWESGFVHDEYPTASAGQAGSCHNTFDTGRVYCPAGGTGIYLDAGTWGCTVKNVTFWGPGNAYHEVGPLAGPDPNVFDVASCTFLNGGSKGETDLIRSVGDPNRKAPETIAWREAMRVKFAVA